MEGLKSLWKYGSWKTKTMVLGVLMMGTVPTVVGKKNKSAEETDQENNLSPKTEEVIDENVIGEASNIGKKANHAISADDLLALADPEAKKNKKKKKNKNQEENNNQATKTKRTQTETRPAPQTLEEKENHQSKVIYPEWIEVQLLPSWPEYSEAEKAKAREKLEKFREENKSILQSKKAIRDIEEKHSGKPSDESIFNYLLHSNWEDIYILTPKTINDISEGENSQGPGPDPDILYLNKKASIEISNGYAQKLKQSMKNSGIELKVYTNKKHEQKHGYKHMALRLNIRENEKGEMECISIDNFHNFILFSLFTLMIDKKVYTGICSINKKMEPSVAFFCGNKQEQIEQYYSLSRPRKQLWGVPKKK